MTIDQQQAVIDELRRKLERSDMLRRQATVQCERMRKRWLAGRDFIAETPTRQRFL